MKKPILFSLAIILITVTAYVQGLHTLPFHQPLPSESTESADKYFFDPDGDGFYIV